MDYELIFWVVSLIVAYGVLWVMMKKHKDIYVEWVAE